MTGDSAVSGVRVSSAGEAPLVAAAVRGLCLATLAAIPLRVLSLGYLPPDDALRHAAKAVSGREWSEILVLRPGVGLDSHPGWHALLGLAHRVAGATAFDLVFLSVAAVFVAFSLAPLLLLRRPEAWLAGLAALSLADPGSLGRLLLGRPFALSAAYLTALCLLWPRLAEPRARPSVLAALTLLVAAVTWIHGSWYLQLLPLACFFLARQTLAGRRYAACLAAGVLLGALATGHPLAFLWQAVWHGYLALGSPEPAATLATEFRSFDGRPLVVAAALGLLAWRGAALSPLARDVPVTLAGAGWLLGFVSGRFYYDWGIPALLVLGALVVQDRLEAASPPGDRRRLVAASLICLVAFLSITSDPGGRWSGQSPRFLAGDDPEHVPWLPEAGGIAYSADMSFFYQTFFRNPAAPWRYVLGFEPGLMPEEDLAVYREILKTHGATEAYLPWVRKLRPQDRLFVRMAGNSPPPVPGLEWAQPVFAIWSGRLPRQPSRVPSASR